MAVTRLVGLAMISIEHAISQNLDLTDLIFDFENMKVWKVSLKTVGTSNNINSQNVKEC